VSTWNSRRDTPHGVPVSGTLQRLGNAMARTPSGGRPSKGDRDHLVTRPPAALGRAVRESAEREGYESISDYLAAVLAAHEGLPQLAPAPARVPTFEELPLQHTA